MAGWGGCGFATTGAARIVPLMAGRDGRSTMSRGARAAEPMSKVPRDLPQWTTRLEAMRRCHSAAALIKDHGEPPHKVRHDSMEIWHYPLGADDGTLYSI